MTRKGSWVQVPHGPPEKPQLRLGFLSIARPIDTLRAGERATASATASGADSPTTRAPRPELSVSPTPVTRARRRLAAWSAAVRQWRYSIAAEVTMRVPCIRESMGRRPSDGTHRRWGGRRPYRHELAEARARTPARPALPPHVRDVRGPG